jgi:RNA polymerase sigma factor (TIGR02999 family)
MAGAGMDGSLQHTVTQLLVDVRAGDRSAFDRLFPIVYQQLHGLAHGQRARWQGDHTLNTTAIVHEAYLKLAAPEEPDWENRAHLLAVAATAMRQILIDYARIKQAKKRGGDQVRVTLDEMRVEGLGPEISSDKADSLIALHEALDRLKERDERQSKVVEYRFFGGMSIPDTATALGVSHATVERDWAMAKAWLFRDMKRARGGQ